MKFTVKDILAGCMFIKEVKCEACGKASPIAYPKSLNRIWVYKEHAYCSHCGEATSSLMHQCGAEYFPTDKLEVTLVDTK